MSIPDGGQPGYWLRVAPTNSNRYYSVPLFYGLWRSDNRGVTWYQPNPSFGNLTVPPGQWIARPRREPLRRQHPARQPLRRKRLLVSTRRA